MPHLKLVPMGWIGPLIVANSKSSAWQRPVSIVSLPEWMQLHSIDPIRWTNTSHCAFSALDNLYSHGVGQLWWWVRVGLVRGPCTEGRLQLLLPPLSPSVPSSTYSFAYNLSLHGLAWLWPRGPWQPRPLPFFLLPCYSLVSSSAHPIPEVILSLSGESRRKRPELLSHYRASWASRSCQWGTTCDPVHPDWISGRHFHCL